MVDNFQEKDSCVAVGIMVERFVRVETRVIIAWEKIMNINNKKNSGKYKHGKRETV